MRSAALWTALFGLGASVGAVDPLEAYGNKFFTKSGTQFFIKGEFRDWTAVLCVAYQLVPDDPLIDTEQCKRDFSLMKELGVNTIRVYHVDAKAKHDGCMKALDDAGIYLLVDMDTFGTYIEARDLYWNSTQYERYSQVMDAFHGYDNVLGFFVGNENIATKDDSPAAPFLKAAARDIKAYRDRKGYRSIPIGYSAADIVQLRPMLQDYLTCGGNSSEIVDFFALNSYSWCDPSTFEASSYNKLQEYAKNFPVPIFFSETGCNVPGPRKWDDQDAIFTKPMVNDWSGALIYEWIQEQNNYGLISYGPKVDASQPGENVYDGFTRKGTPTPISPDFDNLKTKWASINPAGVMKQDYDANQVSTRACPTSTAAGWWQVDGNVKLPTLGETLTGTFTSQASATAETSDKPEPTDSGMSGQDQGQGQGNGSDEGSDSNGSDSSETNEDNAASLDRHLAATGASVAGVVLVFALAL
ncbi:Glycolipid anchored surface protein GAS1 [Metarhizium album ARSEF 1941]|uniref:1,3-beta-glucanosyltransferase n=1 Tax=Metarhizium album (strain ARSEF 1941) TaxID=1081103 RepID=A0A0B2WY03_METAS|nr:Glycolipid anchored surface protein GAS1 [Metarhizium album ARSEF 1941]KHN98267.1 Glycolipid anchored surface protein GAS1 [Metarhizium album ARSEF 1941]